LEPGGTGARRGLISFAGVLARYYIGKKVIDWTDRALMQVPLLNKFTAPSNRSRCVCRKQTFVQDRRAGGISRAGNYSVGFITSEQQGESSKGRPETRQRLCPDHAHPTSGFLILVPEEKLTKLDMSVTDAIKYIVSLGAFRRNIRRRPIPN